MAIISAKSCYKEDKYVMSGVGNKISEFEFDKLSNQFFRKTLE